MNTRLDPYKITNHFRLQPYIEEELAKAEEQLKNNEQSSIDLVELGLVFSEANNRTLATQYASQALKLEEEKTDGQSNEVLATAHYILAIEKRIQEKEDYKDALSEFEQALALTKSDWLISNIQRNMGLVHLKNKDYDAAATLFRTAFNFTNQNSRAALRGSLPALLNYLGLALTKAALASDQNPEEGLAILRETTELYKTIFVEKNINESDQLQSNDYQSHQSHRGIILCQLAEEQLKKGLDISALEKFNDANNLLLGALAGRIKNKADNPRLGDIYYWLARTAAGSNQPEKEKQYLEKGLSHFNDAYPHAKGPHATEIKEMNDRLEKSKELELKTLAFSEQNFSNPNRNPIFTSEYINAFLKDYTLEEKEEIQEDLQAIKKLIFYKKTPSLSPVYLGTAGGPGSSKNTAIETFIRDNNLKDYIYIDADQVTLKNMRFTYGKSLMNIEFAAASSPHEYLENAYNRWTRASNYISHEMLKTAFGNSDNNSEQYSVAHSITATTPHIGSLYERIRNSGYRIVLLLCYAEDETRKKAVEQRELAQSFIQTGPKDVVNKGLEYPKRFDAYFEYADEIHFYWNNELIHGKLPTPCAHYIKMTNGANLMVSNESDWEQFCSQYLQDIRKNNIHICEDFLRFIPQELLNETTPTLQHHGLFSPIGTINVNEIFNDKKVLTYIDKIQP